MKRLLRSLTLALLAAVARAETPTQPLDLLNGRDLSAWDLVTVPLAPADLATICRYQPDGSLAVTGKPMSYLVTKASYENYQLHVEWRWPADAAKNSNSGVLLHIPAGPPNHATWPVCFQAQLKLARSGDLLPMAGATFAEKLSSPPGTKNPSLDRLGDNSEKPPGEWNSYDLVCRGDIIEVTVNGVPQNRVTKCAPATGRIGIQLEGTPYELRHIRLSPLPRAIGSGLQMTPAPNTGGRF